MQVSKEKLFLECTGDLPLFVSWINLTTICVNVRDRVCGCVCLFVRYLLLDRLRYGNMNGTMLSQIVRGMFLAPQVFQK